MKFARLLPAVGLLALLLAFGPGSSVLSGQNDDTPHHNYEPEPGDRLPDIKPVGPAHLPAGEWEVFVQDVEGTRLLRFDTYTANIGLGPLEVSYRTDEQDQVLTNVWQRVYNPDYPRNRRRVRIDGGFEWHPTHSHFHFNDYATYKLFRQNPDGSRGDLVVNGGKISFFLTDVYDYDPNLDPDNLYQVDFGGFENGRVQGISLGKADEYYWGLEGQELDITGLAAGIYILQQVFDPTNRIAELREGNNVLRVRMRLTQAGTVRICTRVAPLC
ncbi:MAG: lysyl oxidase family protein [Dehalococcoidia bacterium]